MPILICTENRAILKSKRVVIGFELLSAALSTHEACVVCDAGTTLNRRGLKLKLFWKHADTRFE